MLTRGVPPIHPLSQDKWYGVHLHPGEHASASVTSATWSSATGASVIIGSSSSYTNPGDAGHPSGYDGPVCSTQLSAATGAAEGDTADITLTYQTDRTEGPLHIVVRVRVSTEGH